MPASGPRTPAYRYHKARDCAVVTIRGKDYYLGTYDSPESREKYHRLVAELLARQPDPPPIPADAPQAVTELIAQYWRFAKGYDVKGGQPTSEIHSVKLALKFVRRLYGSTPAAEFSPPRKLKAVREAMVVHPINRQVKEVGDATGEVCWVRKVVRVGMARKCVNKLVGRIRRLFAWAVEEELLPVEVHAALLRVKGLKRGKTAARETPRVRPVPEDAVDRVLKVLPPTVRAMVEVQRLCGGRPQDVVQLRAADIDRSGSVWEYRPPRHKTEHRQSDGGDADRVLFLGPQAQVLLAPLIAANPDDYLFSPRRSEADRNAARLDGRATPMTPSQAVRRPAAKRKRPPHPHYPVASYRRAVHRACLAASIPIWCPNQLRHTRLTEIRKSFGLEASRVVGGHREVGVTQHYAEQDRDLARKVMAEVGELLYQIRWIRSCHAATAQWKPTRGPTTSGWSVIQSARRVTASVSDGRSSNTRLATASRTSGQNHSAGCNSGVQLGRKWRATFAGTTSFLAVWCPALSTTSTDALAPAGSAQSANACSASLIRSVFTFGCSHRRFRPLAGCEPEHLDRLEVVPPVSGRAGAPRRPHPPRHRLQPEPALVLTPPLHRPRRVRRPQLRHPRTEVIEATSAVVPRSPPSGAGGGEPPAGSRGP